MAEKGDGSHLERGSPIIYYHTTQGCVTKYTSGMGMPHDPTGETEHYPWGEGRLFYLACCHQDSR